MVARKMAKSTSSQVWARARSAIAETSCCVGSFPVGSLPQPACNTDVDQHREQDEEAEDGVAPELAHLRYADEALVELPDQHGTEEGAQDGPGASESADATDDDGGN